jgi:predicted Zn-dependent protease
MGEDERTSGTQVTGPREPEEIQKEIEATREQMGETIEALAAKADVKARAREKVADVKESVSARTDEALHRVRETSPDSAVSAAGELSGKARQNPVPLAAAGAFAVGFLAGRISHR